MAPISRALCVLVIMLFAAGPAVAAATFHDESAPSLPGAIPHFPHSPLVPLLAEHAKPSGLLPPHLDSGADSTDAGIWSMLPTTNPTGKVQASMVYAPERDLIVMFGGSTGSTYSSETLHLEVATGKWTLANPPSSPSGRSAHAAAYDPVGKRMVLFGGYPSSSDTWIYDLANNSWTQLFPSSPPSARYVHTMVFSPEIGKAVLFGGAGSAYMADTWHFDFSTNEWQQVFPSSSPPGRGYHSMAHNAIFGRIVIFGGYAGSQFGDTWVYDPANNTWNNPSPSGSPTARYGHAMSHEPVTRRTLLFGGYDNSYRQDTWAYNHTSNAWNSLAPSPSPAGRAWHMTATAAGPKTVVLFGGNAGSTQYDDTWRYDGQVNRWTSIAGGPAGRYDHGMAYATNVDRVLLFGGRVTGGALVGDSWTFDIANLTWRSASPATSPSPRAYPAMAYDELVRKVVLFGGSDSSGDDNETWQFDPETGNWTQMLPSTSPSSRWGAATAYDPLSKRVVLFGGRSGVSYQSDTWLYDTQNNTWSNANPSPAPTARSQARMSPVGSGGRLALVGGFSGVALGDTWLYNATTNAWTNPNPATTPTSTWSHSLVYDPVGRRLLKFGGNIGPSTFNGQTWLYHLAANSWLLAPAGLSPSSRGSHAMVLAGPGGPGVMFGGCTSFSGSCYSNAYSSETWLYDATPPSAPVVVSTTPVDGANPVATNTDIVVRFDQPMDRASTEAALSAVPAVNGTFTWNGASTQVTWNPLTSLQQATLYSITISSWALSADGLAMSADYQFDFTTSRRPTVVSTVPTNGTTGVGMRETVSVAFDQAMDPSPTSAAYTINPAVSGGFASVYGSTLTWTHSTDFVPATTYTVTITTNARNTLGDNLLSAFSFTFTTALRPTVASTSPADGSVGVPLDAAVTVTFDLDMDPGPTQGAFSISPTVPGSGTLIGRNLTWTHGTDFDPNRSYTVTIGTTAQSLEYANLGTPFTFSFRTALVAPTVVSTVPVDGAGDVAGMADVTVTFDMEMDAPSTASSIYVAPPVSGGVPTLNGRALRWSHATSFLPSTTYTITISTAAMNIWGVHLALPYVFRFTTPSGPAVNSTSPSAGAVQVALDALVLVNFTHDMEPGNTAAAFSIMPSVTGSTVVVTGKQLTFTHTGRFATGTQHQVTIAVTARATSGYPLATAFTFTFTTVPPPIVLGTSPPNGATGVPRYSMVAVEFNTDMDPASTIAAFSIAPPVPGGVGKVSGRTLTWEHSTRFESRTLYTVTIAATASNKGGLNLAAPYTFKFLTSDPAPPRIVGTSPLDGETSVPTKTQVVVAFDIDMDPITTAAAFSITPLVSSGSVNVSGRTLTLRHAEELDKFTLYTVTISDSALSLEGDPLAKSHEFLFATGAAAPRVLATDPQRGQGDVALNAQIIIEFDQEMDPATTTVAITVLPKVRDGTATLKGDTLTWGHEVLFEQNAIYTVTVRRSATSKLGMNMAEDHTLKFATGTRLIARPPQVTVDPADGEIDVPLDQIIVISFSEPMSMGVTEAAVTLKPDVALAFAWDAERKVLTATPKSPLTAGTGYVVRISTGARSTLGAELESQVSATFLTVKVAVVSEEAIPLVVLALLAAIVVASAIAIAVFLTGRKQQGPPPPRGPPPPGHRAPAPGSSQDASRIAAQDQPPTSSEPQSQDEPGPTEWPPSRLATRPAVAEPLGESPAAPAGERAEAAWAPSDYGAVPARSSGAVVRAQSPKGKMRADAVRAAIIARRGRFPPPPTSQR